MATPTNNFKLGKYARLFVAPSAADGVTPADSTFVLVENENDIDVSYKNDKEKVATKSKGKVTLPEGDEEWQLKVTVDAVLTDLGYVNLLGTMNGDRAVQIRDTKTSMVILEGKFTCTDMGFKASQNGVRQTTFTLDNSDTVTLSLATGGRAITA